MYLTMRRLTAASAALLLWGLNLLPVLAAEMPPALSATALVCRVEETDAVGVHKHMGEALWDLKAGKSRLELHPRWLRKRKHYMDVKASWPNDLQLPHFYLVNRDALPAASQPVFPNGCRQTNDNYPVYAKRTFVFAFAIAQIDNYAGAAEPKSPHLLVYLPLQTGSNLRLGIMGEFQLRLMHMEKTEGDYDVDLPADEKKQCEALASLREYWLNNMDVEDAEQKLIERVKKDIYVILMVESGPFANAAMLPLGFAPGDDIIRIHYHNGVIHGTL